MRYSYYDQVVEDYLKIKEILNPKEWDNRAKTSNYDLGADFRAAMWTFFEKAKAEGFKDCPDGWKEKSENYDAITQKLTDNTKLLDTNSERDDQYLHNLEKDQKAIQLDIINEGKEWLEAKKENMIIDSKEIMNDLARSINTLMQKYLENSKIADSLYKRIDNYDRTQLRILANSDNDEYDRLVKEHKEYFTERYEKVKAYTKELGDKRVMLERALINMKTILANLTNVSVDDLEEIDVDKDNLINDGLLEEIVKSAEKYQDILERMPVRKNPTSPTKNKPKKSDDTPKKSDDDSKKVTPPSNGSDDTPTKGKKGDDDSTPDKDDKKRFDELKNKLEIGIITKIELEEFRILVVKYIEEIRVNINVIEEMYINLALSKNDILLGVISVEQLDEFKLLYVKVKNGEKLTDEESIKFESYRKILIKVGVKIQQNVTINTYNVNVFIGNYDELLKQIEILEKLIIDIDIKIRTFVDSNEYTVTFDGNGGKFVDDSTIKRTTVPGGSIVGKPDDPVLDGDHEFDTWVKDDGTPFDFNTPITEDVNLKAKYREKTKKFKVVYNAAPGVFADGTDTKTVEVFPTTISPNPGNPNLPDNDFIGWTFNGTPFDITNTPITQDMELKANYRKRYYVVKFVQEDGTVLETYKVPKDQPLLELPPERGKDGKLLKRLKFKNGEYKKCKTTRLDGWVEGNGVDPFDFSQPITHDIEFKPKYRFNWEKIASIGVGLGVAITAGALAPEALAFATAKAVAATSLVTGGIGIVGKNLSEKYGAKKKLITGAKAPSNILKNACRRIYNETIANPYFWDDLVHANAASALIGIGNAIKNRPIPDPVPVPEWQDVDYDVVVTEDSTTFNGIDYNNAVYRSPEDALNGTNPFNAIKNIWKAGEEHIYKLEYKDSIGNWIETSKGSTLDEVMKQLPAGVNPEEVAVHAWSKDGGMLGFQKLSDCITTIKGTTDWAQTAQNAFDAFKAANGANFSVEEIKNKIIESLVGKGCARDLAEDVVVKLSSGRTM